MGYMTQRGWVEFDGNDDRFTMDQVLRRLEDLESCNLEDLDDDEVYELEEIQAFVSSNDTPCETHRDAEFIADHAFADYARRIEEECGFHNVDFNGWPYNHIDWDRASEALKSSDYVEVEIFGTTYWYHICYES